jgi:dethiobiotin synthetase
MFLLVTGTDTGVGKTVVAAGLARALARSGVRTVAIKPIETGVGGVEDGVLLAEASGQPVPRAALVRLGPAVTPALAADVDGVELDFDGLVASIRRHAEGAEVAIVEGAGGLLAPITWRHNALDLARALDALVVVVAADRLGTINHTLLTLRALEGVDVAALVLSAPEAPDLSTGTNDVSIREHARHQGIPVPDLVITLPRLDDASDSLDALVHSLTIHKDEPDESG